MQKYIQKNLTRSIFIVFSANTLALFFHWYRLLWWFDMPMHFLGGFFLVWFVLTIHIHILKYRKSKIQNNQDVLDFEYITKKGFIKKVLLSAFILGLSWELFEIVVDLYTMAGDMHILDTISDLFFDMAGAFTAIFMLNLKYYFYKKDQETKFR